MKTKRIARALRTGMKGGGIPHRSELRVPMSREAFDAVADALLNRLGCVKSAEHRRGRAAVVVKVFGPADIARAARALRTVLTAACRRDRRALRFVKPPPWPADSCGCEGCRGLGL